MLEWLQLNTVWVFAATLLAVVALEVLFPWHARPFHFERMSSNFLLGVMNKLVLRWLLPGALLGMPLLALSWGLNLSRWLPPVFEVVITVLVLDCARYWAHRLFHRYAWLWRLHRVHHSDRDVDFTTSVRHHPLENIVLVLMFLPLYLSIGFSLSALVAYGALNQSVTFFAHTNTRVPSGLDAFLRVLIVTPHVHRVHHSCERALTDSNYGSVLTLWDRLFGTYQSPSKTSCSELKLGLKEYTASESEAFVKLLLMPFKS